MLRDETGPDERLVFLELPSSLYTVPKVDDDQMVKIDWSVSEYYSRCNQEGGGSPERRFPNFYFSKSLLESIENANKFIDKFSVETADGETTRQPPPITDEYLDRFNRLMRSDQYLDHVVEAISYQRQRSIYEQFINQDAFGSQVLELAGSCPNLSITLTSSFRNRPTLKKER